MPLPSIHDRVKWPASSGLVLSTILLTRSIPTSFAFDKVVHSAIAVLACSGGAIVVASRFLPVNGNGPLEGGQHDSLALDEVGRTHALRRPSPERTEDSPFVGIRKLRIVFFSLILALCLRVELLRDITRNVQCAAFSWEPLVPLVLALLEYRNQRERTRSTVRQADVGMDSNKWSLSTSHLTIASMTLVSFASMFALHSTNSPQTTVVCAAILPYRWLIPLLQRLGSALDVVIVYCISQLLFPYDVGSFRNLAKRFSSIGFALLFSASTLLTIGIVYYAVQEQDRKWIVTITPLYFWSVWRLSMLAAFAVLCTLVSFLSIGVLTTTTTMMSTVIVTVTTTAAWTQTGSFPIQYIGNAYLAVCLILLGLLAYAHLDTSADSVSLTEKVPFRRAPVLLYLIAVVLVFTWMNIWSSNSAFVHQHPIDLLISRAQENHKAYVTEASISTNLAKAVAEYQRRYGRYPPPHFDMWYQYATERSSVIIDEFDRIDQDLQPFYALTPEEIRSKTWDLMSNPWNDAAGIMIRDGEVEVSPKVMDTHRWMVDGVVEMVSKFSQWLPDMDLAFNLNDEPRVVVPYEVLEPMKRPARMSGFGNDMEPDKSFTLDRAEQWAPIQVDDNPDTPLRELSWQRTFHRYGMMGCPPGSPARTQRHWDTGSFCTSCASPHSFGGFFANWTIAADICHQPDMADLHGLYLSPAAFKSTHELFPIFSQSKAHGFNDILYPSAWNYIQNAKYEPTEDLPDVAFAEKEGTIFWRGATSEGVSKGRGSWRGMTRQRFIHMANNVNNSAPPQALLLPAQGHPDKLEYETVPSSKLTELLHTDIHIVHSILRCAGPDCADQDAEFAPFAPPTDFQTHWHYKHLLDMDGAGFSGRFLAFLQSRSLPFKTALFREWWDDRITPWHHFVPLDLRGQGFWATLAYFNGINGTVNGKGVKMEAHAAEAERIATEGKAWAEKVLRKEDMEIYFFRLLLEWGRLTDDKREGLGFRV